MAKRKFESFEEFWPYYLGEHENRTNRTLHAIGTTAACVTLGMAAARKSPKLLALAPVLGYAPAWIGHFLIEKNKPATFKHPLWSLKADLRMASLMLTGQLDDEMARVAAHADVIDLYK
ncbi:MAG: hypothetical protein CMJ85_14345 [Planctomycetes bacterium]|jgi:hypothetical protein|nr:hypothetical protein [Planctomycetota bacterium]MEC9441219.1 DUF962 domain-containing protein [Myxococcota bacterium]